MQQKSSRFLYWPSTLRQVHCEKFTITSVYPPLILYCSKIHFRWQQRIMLDNFLPNLFFINWKFRLKCTTDKCRIIGKWDKCICAWIHPLTEDTSTMSLDCCIQQFKLVMTSNSKCFFSFQNEMQNSWWAGICSTKTRVGRKAVYIESEIQAYLYCHMLIMTLILFLLLFKSFFRCIFWVKYFFCIR